MSAPRLIVPGRVDVVVLDGGQGVVELGARADVAPAVPAQEDLGHVALVPLAALSRAPWAELDLGARPHLQTQLSRLGWVLVEPDVARTAHGQGHDALFVQGGVAGARWVPAQGEARSFEAADPVLWGMLLGEEPDPDVVHRWAETGGLQDRIVRAMTGERVSLRDLELARWASALRPASLPHEEAVLAEIALRALDHADKAEALVAALAGAADQDEVPVPVYGRATRVVDPAFTLKDGGAVRVTGPPIQVPAAVSWLVEDVAPWESEAVHEHRLATFADWHAKIQETRARSKRRERLVWGLIGVLLILGLAVGLLGQIALSRMREEAPPTPESDLQPDPEVDAPTDRAPTPPAR